MDEPVTAEELYQSLKEALKFFSLRFHEMDQMTVSAGVNSISFTHKGKTVTGSTLRRVSR